MDLVLTYVSDDEMDNKSNLKKTVKKNHESSDDSDSIDIVFEAIVSKGSAARKSGNPSSSTAPKIGNQFSSTARKIGNPSFSTAPKISNQFSSTARKIGNPFSLTAPKISNQFSSTACKIDEPSFSTASKISNQFSSTARKIGNPFSSTAPKISNQFSSTARKIDEPSSSIVAPYPGIISIAYLSELASSTSTACKIGKLSSSTASKSRKPTNTPIEIISIDDSDSETIIPFPPIREGSSKRFDFLNLESSDTDDEQKVIQKNVSNLLSSAAILNDIEYGPIKTEPNISTALTSCIYQDQLGEKRQSLPSTSTANVHYANITTSSVSGVSRDKVGPTLPSTSSVNGHYDNNTASSISEVSRDKVYSTLPSTSSVNVHYDNNTASSISDVSRNKDCSQNLSKRYKSSICTDRNGSVIENLAYRINMYREEDRISEASKGRGTCSIPSVLTRRFAAHQKALSSLSWCPMPYSHLFLSSSLDSYIKVWDIYCQYNPVQILQLPFGVRAAKWSKNGEIILTGGFGKRLHVFDVLSGKRHMVYPTYNAISCIAIHPFIEDVVLCGTKNAIFGFDLRVDSDLPVRTFLSNCGEVLDIAFLNKNEFVCSTSVVSRDSADRTIMVWDFNSGAIMSKQIFLERYTCPSLKLTPAGSGFIAQTNGDYIALFSSQKPYKIMNKRYMGHKVSGYGIECDISPDSRYVASGDAKGDVYFYNSSDTRLVKQLTIKRDFAVNRLHWHPVLSSTMAFATWDGQVQVWK